MDEFWIDPLAVEGAHATIRACFNQFTVTIIVERKDGSPIEKQEALTACDAVAQRLPKQASLS